MDEDIMRKQLLFSWISAFEKAIVADQFGLAKNILDSACDMAVEDFTDRLKMLGVLKEIKGREFLTIEEAIHHHIDNLVKAGIWEESNRPELTVDKDHSDIVYVHVKKCDYLEPCKASYNHHSYHKDKFPCQRVGCFVGAAKKYLSEEKISDKERSKIKYFMKKIYTPKGCHGVIFINDGTLGKFLRKMHIDEQLTD